MAAETQRGRTADGSAWWLHGPAEGAADRTADEAPPLVLIHGLGLNRHCWDWQLPALAARHRVLAYDLYGHGDSAAPPGRPDLTLYAAQLAGLLDALEIPRAVLIGFSLGGMINRRFAMDYPGRAAALAILNSPHERSAEAQRLVEQRAADSGAGPAATLDATLERWFTAAFRAAQPQIIERVRRWVLGNDPQHYAHCRQVLASGVIELIRPQPPIGGAGGAPLPTLVMTAENDSGSTPAMARAIAAEIAGARLHIVPRLQHMGLVEEPALFVAPLLEFLDQLRH